MSPSSSIDPSADPVVVASVDGDGPLESVVDMVREISRQTDPQAMIQVFRRLTRSFYGGERSVSVSRRDLTEPAYRITRSSRFARDINPWTERDRLPVFSGGLLAELVYGDRPRILNEVCIDPGDPAAEHLDGARSLMYLPLFDGGVGVNGVLRISSGAAGFDHINLADAMLTGNLFGQATNNLLVAQRLRSAYAELDHELARVGRIQRSLLPPRLPDIPTLDIAASYKPAARAGGDYYDFFELEEGRWGMLIADVSGHGTPAAVVMAMLRTMLHARCQHCKTPSEVLCYANERLCNQADEYDGTFVTAFYGIYDPADRSFRYASAGHNPPLLVDRQAGVRELDEAQALPLAVDPTCAFIESRITLEPGDTLILYTDGITEAFSADGEAYGRDRLLSCVCQDAPSAQHIIDCVVHKLMGFTEGGVQHDDQTLLAMRVR